MSTQLQNCFVFNQSDIAVVAQIGWKDNDVNRLTNMPTQEAPLLLNRIQRALDTSRSGQVPVSFTSTKALRKFRGRAIRLLVRLSRHYAIFPEVLFLEGVKCSGERDPAFHGGFADIFQGTLENAMVAMKRIRVYTSDEERRRVQDMLRKEAILWRQLDHPHILPFLGIDTKTFAPQYTIVSPWMKNGNLLEFIEREKSAPPQINLLVAEVAKGLQHLHEQGIAHGDLRAANVLIKDTHQACLADFGLARLSAGMAPRSIRAHETSARWLAPELLAGDEITVTFEGDVFALGRVCLEAYTLNMPFWYIQREATVIKKILAGEDVRRPTSEETGFQDMSDKMWQLLKLCWAKAPYKRPSVTQLLALLERIADKPSVVQTLQTSGRLVRGLASGSGLGPEAGNESSRPRAMSSGEPSGRPVCGCALGNGPGPEASETLGRPVCSCALARVPGPEARKTSSRPVRPLGLCRKEGRAKTAPCYYRKLVPPMRTPEP